MVDEKQIIKDFAKWVDDQIDFTKIVGGIAGVIAERFDGALFKIAIEIGYKKTPTAYKASVIQLMSATVDGDLDKIADGVIENVVKAIKTPLGDEQEGIILGGLWDIIHGLIKAKQ